MLSEDILLSPGSGWLDVPVYCTEHGRWSGTSTKFATKGQVAAGRLRERAAKSGSQSEVWDEVGAARADLDIQSPGTAFARVYDDVRVQEEAERYMARLQNLPALGGRTCGVLVAVGERVVCVDAFGSVTLFSKMWPKLLRSYVIDAMSGRGRGSLTQRRAQEFLRAAAQGKVTAEPTAGAGQRHRITAANSSGSALAFGREVVHLDLFPDDGGRSGTDEGPAPSLRVRRDRSRD
jgi:hypothetical protein